MIPWLGPDDPSPPVEQALRDPDGLLAAGADLTPARLLDAYTRRIFPWYSEDEPLLWWSPDPRMVLFTSDVRVVKSLQRVIRSGRFTATFDTAFAEVMAGCAAPRRDDAGTWITDEMIAAYTELHRAGHAHSIEVWAGDELAGGLYGVAIGRMFFGESMFSRQTDASKVALVTLARQLGRWGFELIDCQVSSPHLASLGAREIARAEFIRRVSAAVARPAAPSPWRLDPATTIEG
jgi:leucyl/phenylalanyl-tRNA---protein transferase